LVIPQATNASRGFEYITIKTRSPLLFFKKHRRIPADLIVVSLESLDQVGLGGESFPNLC